MKKIPLTIIPLIVIGFVAYEFVYIVPAGGDLISESGDTILGIIVGASLVLCIIFDVRRFIKSK
jgi:hypothetical protein